MTRAAMSPERPICLVLGALGGQGGGVLADWLVEASLRAGFPAQATSIPGVAQRTGATTYYFELYPEKNPPAEPVFCLFPSADDVDLVAAMEPTEAGRALEKGLVTRRTQVITAKGRVYSTAEKVIAGNGTVEVDRLLAALAAASGRLLALDFDRIAKEAGCQINAAMFGAIAASGILPLSPEDCRGAIQDAGVAVRANLAGFEAGFAAAAAGSDSSVAALPAVNPPPSDFGQAVDSLPEELRALAGHGVARLVDYQDAAYGALYLERLGRIAAKDRPPYRAAKIVATRLAAWMSYEDGARVAQLKTRPGRLDRIKAEMGVGEGEQLSLREYFRPGPDQISELLPSFLGFLAPKGHGGLKLKIPTDTAFGYGMLRLIAGLKGWRRRSARYAREQRAIEVWLAAVADALAADADLGLKTAELSVLARGYGEVRSRGLARLARLLENWGSRLADPAGSAAALDAALHAARFDPDAEFKSRA